MYEPSRAQKWCESILFQFDSAPRGLLSVSLFLSVCGDVKLNWKKLAYTSFAPHGLRYLRKEKERSLNLYHSSSGFSDSADKQSLGVLSYFTMGEKTNQDSLNAREETPIGSASPSWLCARDVYPSYRESH